QTMLVRAAEVPVIEAAGVRLRVLAGNLAGRQSPLSPPQPILIIDGSLATGARTSLPLAAGWNLWIYGRTGGVWMQVDDEPETTALAWGAAAGVPARREANVPLRPQNGGAALVKIAGPSIEEPSVQAGPFVINSQKEAEQAVADYHAGK